MNIIGVDVGNPQSNLDEFCKFPEEDILQQFVFDYPIHKINSLFDSGNAGGQEYYWSRSIYLKPAIPNAQKTNYCKTLRHIFRFVLSPLLKFMEKETIDITVNIETVQMGGKISQIAKDACAFTHRDANFEIHCIFTRKVNSYKVNQDEILRQMKLANSYYGDNISTLASSWEYCSLSGGYINTDNLMVTSDINQLEDRVFGSNIKKLKEMKAVYDPTNFFNNHHCILPNPSLDKIEYSSIALEEFINDGPNSNCSPV